MKLAFGYELAFPAIATKYLLDCGQRKAISRTESIENAYRWFAQIIIATCIDALLTILG